MAIGVLIKRVTKHGENAKVLLPHIIELRALAVRQPGYISGETLINHYDPCNITVVSTWQTIDDWIRWQESDEREVNETQLENLLEAPTQYEIYDVGRHHEDTEQHF